MQRGRIVDAVAHKSHSLALALQLLDQLGFVFRTDFRKNIFSGDARFLSDAASRPRIITSDEKNSKPLPPKLSYHVPSAGLDGVLEREQSG